MKLEWGFNMNIAIVPLAHEHIKEVAKISSISFPKAEQWDVFSLKGELVKHISHSFVALIDEKVVGFIGMWIIIDEAQINTIAINPEYRNKKIGTALIEHIINYCKQSNVTSISLEVRESNDVAKKLYLNKGFLLEGERKNYYSNNKETALLLKLNIDN